MEMLRFSKSFYANAKMCPWRAHQIHVLRVQDEPGQAATDGIEVHKLREDVLTKKKTLEQAKADASSERVRALLTNTFEFDEFLSHPKQKIELWVALNRKGLLAQSKEEEIIVGFMDRVIPRFDGKKHSVLIEDLKTGRETNNELERHLYALFGFRAFPGTQLLRFDYYYAQTGKRSTYLYEVIADGAVQVTDTETGAVDSLWTDDGDPVWNYVDERLFEIEEMECVPTPGPHCESLYGRPCMFLGNGCPACPKLPAVINEGPSLANSPAAIMALPAEDRPGAAFMALLTGTVGVDDFTPEIAAAAYAGAQQVSGASRRVTNAVRQWAADTDAQFALAGATYGMRPKRTVDAVAAIEIMLAERWPAVDMARACNVSVTSIKRLPKQYADVKKLLMDLCVDETGGTEFGVLKDTEF